MYIDKYCLSGCRSFEDDQWYSFNDQNVSAVSKHIMQTDRNNARNTTGPETWADSAPGFPSSF